MKTQLIFDLPWREKLDRGNFTVTPASALALAGLDSWKSWPDGRMIIAGPPGSGKTHLATIWASETGAVRLPARELSLADLPKLVAGGKVAVENAEDLAGYHRGETALLHLYNMIAAARSWLLITADAPPRDWGLRLPDLLSRLQATALTRLEAPDDQLLEGVLRKLFADRQLQPLPSLIPWLLLRMPRSLQAARVIVARMDALALQRAQPPGPRLAAEVLELMAEEENSVTVPVQIIHTPFPHVIV